MKTATNLLSFMFMLNLQRFAAEHNTNTSESESLSPEMKDYYSDYLIDNAEPELVHAQFGQKRPIPKNNGKTAEFRKFTPYPNAGVLVEGVTPKGRSFEVTKLEAKVQQYGDYTTLSDILSLTAIDNNIAEVTKLHGAQAGRTLDSVIRDVLNGGTNVQYADGSVSARTSLVGGKADGNHYLTIDAINLAVRSLKRMNTPKINGTYVAIIHPDVSHDIKNDPKWWEAHKYASPENIFEGEIGKIGSVRFVETSEAKIFEGAGADGRDIYSTLVLGADAYGIIEVNGGGLRHIFKNFGSGGTEDPLDQRATVGWKAVMTAVRLVESSIVRIETASSY